MLTSTESADVIKSLLNNWEPIERIPNETWNSDPVCLK